MRVMVMRSGRERRRREVSRFYAASFSFQSFGSNGSTSRLLYLNHIHLPKKTREERKVSRREERERKEGRKYNDLVSKFKTRRGGLSSFFLRRKGVLTAHVIYVYMYVY
jgi:hypothetical protein